MKQPTPLEHSSTAKADELGREVSPGKASYSKQPTPPEYSSTAKANKLGPRNRLLWEILISLMTNDGLANGPYGSPAPIMGLLIDYMGL